VLYRLAVLLLVIGLFAACGPAGGPGEGRRLYTSDLAPNPGSGLDPKDQPQDPPPEEEECPDATLASIRDQILLPHCASCHSGGLAPEALDLSVEPEALLARLALASRGSPSGMPLVRAGQRGGSYLYLKVFLENPLAGDQMPKEKDPLSACQIEALGDWIDAGAL
jgi:hypothetical protein